MGLSIMMLVLMRSKPLSSGKRSPARAMTLKQLGNALLLVLKNPQMWLIGIIGCLFYLPASVFLDLWGISYLKAVYQLTPEQAASAISWTFLGWIIAGPTIGALSDKIKR